MKKDYFLLLFLLCACLIQARSTYHTDKDIPYIPDFKTDAYRLERCKLDAYYPENKKDFSTTVWFHGDGMGGGSRLAPGELTGRGFTVVAVDCRLSPKTKNPAHIKDATETIAWTFRNIEKYGSRKDRIFVSGHSAGGYLTLILTTDKKYMATYGTDTDSVATYLPVSGQTVTHFTIRKERGLPNGIPIIDESAPVNRVCKDTAPVVLVTEDKNLEMTDRYEENALLAPVLRDIGNRRVSLYELQRFNHG